MPKVDLDSTKASKPETAPSVDDELNNDEFYAAIVSNEASARVFFSMFLPTTILEQIDLSTLRTMHTRDVDPNGVVTIGDIFFMVDMKDRPGRNGRRTVFVIVSEHKLKDDPHVSIQLLGYVAALLKRMSGQKDDFVDAEGRLPAPYPILFSQDNRPKNPPPYLSEIVWNIDGLEEFVPFFKFQAIYVTEVPLETIKSCEPVMRAFLHLTQIANKKHTTEEDAELAETFRLLLDSPESDERARQCAVACLHYFVYLQKRRPGMLTVPELRQEIGKQKGEKMDKYDGICLFFEKEISERYGKETAARCEKAREDGFQDGFQDGVQTGVQTGIQTGVYNTIYRNLRTKYGEKPVSKKLSEKIDAINYYPALEDVQTAVWTTRSLAAFERKVDEIAKQYETEIQETRR